MQKASDRPHPQSRRQFTASALEWGSDVVKGQLEPVNEFVCVAEAPGLGVTLDRDALERASEKIRSSRSSWFGGIRRLIPMSYASAISTEYWDDDGTAGLQGDILSDRARRHGSRAIGVRV